MEVVNIKNTSLMTGIYLINYPNGKVYIGQAQNIHRRILEHNSRAKIGHRGDGQKLQICDQSIRKYFPNGIKEYIVLEKCLINELDDKEKYWIEVYEAKDKTKGYNFLDKGNVSGRRGVDNINASISQEQLDKIIDLLLNHHEYSYKDIANQTNSALHIVQNISWGKTYIQDNLKYPLRNNNHTAQQKNSVTDYFKDVNKLIELKEDLKYSWWLTIEKDLTKKYSIPLKIMYEINVGKKFSEIGDYDYPIRPKNIRNPKSLTKEDIINILKELKETNNTMEKIGLKYNLTRKTISNINKGNIYLIKDYIYPARKTT